MTANETRNEKEITMIKMSELPSDAVRYRPENKSNSRTYKCEAKAKGVCKRLLTNKNNGWEVGSSFKGFLVVTEDRFPVGHEYFLEVTIWFQ